MISVCHVIGERMQVTPMISLDPIKCAQFWISIIF